MKTFSQRAWWYVFFLLILIPVNIGIGWFLVHPPVSALRVSFLNIGQGDSILIQGPTGVKLLVDGGPDRSVLRQLSRELLPWDRRVDAVVETHPDKDHIAGLGEVLDRYQVGTFLESGIPDATSVSQHVKVSVAREPGIEHRIVHRGMRLHLGGGAYADVLFPDRDESHQKVTNDGSVVLHVVYGSTAFLLTGDLPSTYEDYLVGLDGNDGLLVSDVLKAGHHGSKYSTDALWLRAVRPDTVVISAGKDNPYGHPSGETLNRIQTYGARIVSTSEQGTFHFVSDGHAVSLRER